MPSTASSGVSDGRPMEHEPTIVGVGLCLAVHCADVRFIGDSGPVVALLTQLPPHTECGPVP